MTAASAEWAQYATAPRQRPMLVAYSGCIAQIKHYSLAGARTRDLAERTFLLAQEFKRIGCCLCWLWMKGVPRAMGNHKMKNRFGGRNELLNKIRNWVNHYRSRTLA